MSLKTVIDSSSTFLSISEQLLNVTSYKIVDKHLVNKYLCDLNNINYNTFSSLENDVAVLLINRLCSNIQSTEINLIRIHCKFITNVLKMDLKLSEGTLLFCMNWICRAIDENRNFDNNLHEMLIVMKQLIEVSPFDDIQQNIYSLLNEDGLIRFLILQSSSNLTQSGLLTLNCIDAFLKNKETSAKTLQPNHKTTIAKIVINFVQSTQRNEQNQLFYYQAICSGLRILCYLCTDKLLTDSIDPNIIGEILGIVQVFLFYGINGYLLMKPKQLRPSAMVIPERIQTVPRCPVQNINKSRAKRQQQLKKGKCEKKSLNDSTNSINSPHSDIKTTTKYSSDSDTSDSEIMNPARGEAAVRLAAIHLLLKIIKGLSPRDVFGYWPQIIVSTTGINARVLLSLIMKEPVAKLRQTSLTTLAEAILEARTFLTYAEDDTEQHSAFTTFFGTVGAMIKELHLGLSFFLNTERNLAIITHALKCVNALVQVTPYTRLMSGFATKISASCKVFIKHKDPTTKVAALSVFEALASKDKLTPEIITILSEIADKSENDTILDDSLCSQLEMTIINNEDNSENIDELDYTDNATTANATSAEKLNSSPEDDEDNNDNTFKENATIVKELDTYLLQVCLKNISDKTLQIPVRLQSLKVLGALVNKDICHLIFNHINFITIYLVETLQETETQVALHSGRVLEKISCSLKENLTVKDQIKFNFWSIIFQHLINLAQNSHSNLREVACNCLGTVDNEIFNQLPFDQHVLIVTTLFGAVRDDESSVRAAALRSLGMLILLPTVEEDTGFVMDLANLSCTSLEDENLGVRIKAAWALANLSDCLINQLNNNDIEPIPLDILLPSLCKVSLKAAQDNNKVRCNAVRAVGNLLYLSQALEIQNDFILGIDILIKCATTGNDMKVRWNACRAFGFIISKDQISIVAPNWQDKAFPALCDLICHSPNFKVRTNAAWALTNCKTYRKYIPYLWKHIVLALDNSQHVPNYVEYHHRDSLIQQLCLALGHVAVHTNLEDLPALWLEIKDRLEDIVIHMNYFRERVLPEETDDFVNAKLKFDNYAQSASTSNERDIASVLANLFNLTNIYND